ncbi:cyclodeaminase/cyclohydrolase family protein [Microbacterium sp. 179-I 3D3 NHS]|uniref:cyclodeaminase/cyclohydrolase family protein n=1 Tax=Microbacterium sp. 179-I 3D3 NHS TaxID=3142382 RepID=UPI0039A34DEA
MQESDDISTSTPLDGWLAELGRPHGAPGGGAAAGVMLGIAASLLRMVAEYTPDDDRAARCGERLADVRAEALAAVEADGVSSAGFGAALALPADDPDRDARVRDAAVDAAVSSVRLGDVGIRLIPEIRLLADIGNPHLTADLAVASEALRAGISGAIINLRSNVRVAQKHEGSPAEVSALLDSAARMTAARDEVAGIAVDLSGDDG